MVRNLFKKRPSKREEQLDRSEAELEPDKPERPAMSDPPTTRGNVSYEETDIDTIEPPPPQPVFIDPGPQSAANPAFQESPNRSPTDLNASQEEAPSGDLPPIPKQQKTRRSWRSHIPQMHMPQRLQNLSFRRKKQEQEQEQPVQPQIQEPIVVHAPPSYGTPSYYETSEKQYQAQMDATARFRENLHNINSNRIPGRAWGWDYINWKPVEYRRRENHPNEFPMYSRALAPYVAQVKESGIEGAKERSSVLPPPPLGVRSAASNAPSTLYLSTGPGSVY